MPSQPHIGLPLYRRTLLFLLVLLMFSTAQSLTTHTANTATDIKKYYESRYADDDPYKEVTDCAEGRVCPGFSAAQRLSTASIGTGVVDYLTLHWVVLRTAVYWTGISVFCC